jgi:hypothetical protein
VFLTVGKLPLFFLQHKGMHKFNIILDLKLYHLIDTRIWLAKKFRCLSKLNKNLRFYNNNWEIPSGRLHILIRNRVMWNRTYLRQLFWSNCVWTVTDCSNIVAVEFYVSTLPLALTIGYARLLARRSGLRIPVGKDFLSRQYAHSGSGAHPAPCSMGTGVLFLG